MERKLPEAENGSALEQPLSPESPADAEQLSSENALEPMQSDRSPEESEPSSQPSPQLDEEPVPKVDPSFKGRINDDKPWVVIAGSYAYWEDAEEKVEQLEAALFFSDIEDSRSFETFACCYHTVVAGRFSTPGEAKELSDRLIRAGFRSYVKRGFDPIDAFDDYRHTLLRPDEIPPNAVPGHFTHPEAKEWVELKTEQLDSWASTYGSAELPELVVRYRASLVLYHQEGELVARTELMELSDWAEAAEHDEDWEIISTLVDSESGRAALLVYLDYIYASTDNGSIFVVAVDDLDEAKVLWERTGLLVFTKAEGPVELFDLSIDERETSWARFEASQSLRLRLRDGEVHAVEHGESARALEDEDEELCVWEEGVLTSCQLFNGGKLRRECGAYHCDEEPFNQETVDDDGDDDDEIARDSTSGIPPVLLTVDDFDFHESSTSWGPVCRDYFDQLIQFCGEGFSDEAESSITKESMNAFCHGSLQNIDQLIRAGYEVELSEAACKGGMEVLASTRWILNR
ncbi:MAG: hypothetical protein RBU37_03990 [Myxococcota bacterium]|nr:hypothetical protein [Myxococcota bacterium]